MARHGRPVRAILGFWRGEAEGTATITLARADAENGAVVALLWGEKVETQPLPFDIEVFIIDTALQNESAPCHERTESVTCANMGRASSERFTL